MILEEAEKIAKCKQIQEGLRCMICVEYFDSPHTLECGHSYCQGCLHQWLNNKKSCPECRLPVSRPPCPSYVLQKIVDAVKPLIGISVTRTSSDGNSTSANLWTTLFPHHNPHGYFRDESDGVARCASCLNELEPDGECANCNLQYELDSNDEEHGNMGNPIDLDMDDDMDHEDEDDYNESDLEFLNDGEVEYDSDVTHDIDLSSDEDDFDRSSVGLPAGYDSSDLEDLSDSAAQLNIHGPTSDDEHYSEDDDTSSIHQLGDIWRLGVPEPSETDDFCNGIDTSSSEDDDDDDTADYAGLADFQDEYGSAVQHGNNYSEASRNTNNGPPSSTSTNGFHSAASTSTSNPSTSTMDTVYLSSSTSSSENSDSENDSNRNTRGNGNGGNKKRLTIIETDDDNDDEQPVPTAEHTTTSNVKSNKKRKNKSKNKDKGKATAIEGDQQTKKKHKKKKTKKNKKQRTLD